MLWDSMLMGSFKERTNSPRPGFLSKAELNSVQTLEIRSAISKNVLTDSAASGRDKRMYLHEILSASSVKVVQVVASFFAVSVSKYDTMCDLSSYGRSTKGHGDRSSSLPQDFLSSLPQVALLVEGQICGIVVDSRICVDSARSWDKE